MFSGRNDGYGGDCPEPDIHGLPIGIFSYDFSLKLDSPLKWLNILCDFKISQFIHKHSL